jgi:hypothetical protein
VRESDVALDHPQAGALEEGGRRGLGGRSGLSPRVAHVSV